LTAFPQHKLYHQLGHKGHHNTTFVQSESCHINHSSPFQNKESLQMPKNTNTQKCVIIYVKCLWSHNNLFAKNVLLGVVNSREQKMPQLPMTITSV